MPGLNAAISITALNINELNPFKEGRDCQAE